MDEDLSKFTLRLAGRTVDEVWDRLLRYCGLPWSGGDPETWAYRYYDLVETDPDRVTQVDVLSAAALHPGFSKGDLGYFWEAAGELERWLAPLPHDLVLRDADESVLAHLSELSGWADAPTVTLLSKVLHRKRPALIPLVDRHILDWYRPVTGERTAAAAWPGLVRALKADLGGENALLLAILNVELENRLERPLTHLRLADIAVWMGAQA